MSIVNRAAFAAICEMSIHALNVYISRNKVAIMLDKQIDTENPLNLAFKKKRKQMVRKAKSSSSVAPVPKERIYTKPLSASQVEEKKAAIKEAKVLITLEKRKRKADVIKAETDSELKKLQLEKMMGKLIPVDLMQGILKINIQNIFMSFDNELVNIASIYCDVMAGGDRSKLSDIVHKMRENLGRIISDTKLNAAKEIEGVINEYSEVRSRGERK